MLVTVSESSLDLRTQNVGIVVAAERLLSRSYNFPRNDGNPRSSDSSRFA